FETGGAGVGNLASAIDELAGEDLHALGGAALGDSIVELTGLLGRLQAERLRRLAVFDAAGGAAASGARGTAGWLRWRCRTGAGQAATQVSVARALDRTLPGTRAALAAGDISFEHARVLVYATADVPAELVAAAEPMLVDHAHSLEPNRLRIVAEHWRAHVVPDASDRDADHAYQRRRLDIAATFDGTVVVNGLLDGEAGTTVLTAVTALADSLYDPAAPTPIWARRADALVELARRGLDTGLPEQAGERPHLQVTVDWATLVGRGAADLDWQTTIPAEAARQLACDAGVSRILTGPASQPLDVGRRTRTIPPQLRRAMHHRDAGCSFPGCGQSPQFTDCHHLIHWAHGGDTALHNLVLLCHTHHRLVHEGRWTLRRHPDGHLQAIPPDTSTPITAAPPRGGRRSLFDTS
ncbi:MAG TPA: DUF222 domain-containing protein, partial [Frankiaceae bacterium]|nr:DUF222 domain-containing protein [Frankiaceae bacterium]